MAVDKCLERVRKLLDESSITSTKQEEILNAIRLAQAEKKVSSLDEINVEDLANEVTERIKLQKKINKRNALENEIKIRKLTQYVLDEFPDDPKEGLIAITVGSNLQKLGARASVALAQQSSERRLLVGLNQKLRDNNVDELFSKLKDNADIERRVVRTMYEKSRGDAITETQSDIKKLGEILEEYSENVRISLNDRGANIEKLWGYIVRQSHDPFKIRGAAKILGKDISGKDNYVGNFEAWKEFVLERLDKERTFANTQNVDEFLAFAYNSLVNNDNLKIDGTNNQYGGRDVAKGSAKKRVLHFKTSDDWFDYNKKFGAGDLAESFYGGLINAGRNIGMIDTLGTKPRENYAKIINSVKRSLVKDGKDSSVVGKETGYDKYLNVVDGTIYQVGSFGFAKWSGITRAIASMSKLGAATISAMADIGLYASELQYQGRSYLGGVAEAMTSLSRIKNTKFRREIAEQLGFIADNTIYDVSARFSIGDNLSKGFTQAQRTFFKLNILSFWTNSLKEGAMLGMANYFAKNKSVKFDNLNIRLKTLLKQFDIDSTKWDIIRKQAMRKAEDGTEFLNIKDLDQISDADVKKITGLKNMTKRQIQIEKEKFRTSVSGILLDRSIYAVIEQDARTKSYLTQGLMAGTPLGEAIRFVTQFKAFPFAIVQKALLGREGSFFKAGNAARGTMGIIGLLVASGILGYTSMTAKDLLKGRTPRDPTKIKTILAGFLQGGGLGIYGDMLFAETTKSTEIFGRLAGPVPGSVADIVQAIQFGVFGKGGAAGRQVYRTVTNNIPFLNLFYIKTAFDYLIGYQIAEYLSPGFLRRTERRLKRDYDQEFIFTNPSSIYKGF
tara:strand:+ start:388 stop:2916 length:2529 start_codon:yes stop_codon:yes gene_type:complete